MNISFEELQSIIVGHTHSIDNVQEEISMADNDYELARLSTELDFYEEALLIAEEIMADTIDKGRGD